VLAQAMGAGGFPAGFGASISGLSGLPPARWSLRPAWSDPGTSAGRGGHGSVYDVRWASRRVRRPARVGAEPEPGQVDCRHSLHAGARRPGHGLVRPANPAATLVFGRSGIGIRRELLRLAAILYGDSGGRAACGGRGVGILYRSCAGRAGVGRNIFDNQYATILARVLLTYWRAP
jgi:hypothetical protein